MKSLLVILIGIVLAVSSPAATRYVDVNSTIPIPPYTNWATAANVIQDAADVAEPGDQILVTNGVYATGGRAIHGAMTNRMAVDKPLNIRSVNGPRFTVIEGLQGAGWASVRCAYLTDGATLVGFTLTNGGTVSQSPLELGVGGGVYCSSLSAIVSNCVIVGNVSSWQGGGAYAGTFYDCALTNNKSDLGWGAGASWATLYNCTLIANSGGGAFRSTLNSCIISSNSAGSGGGADSSTLNKCTLTGNIAGSSGGARFSTLNNCTLTFNSAQTGGGAMDSTLTDCTLAFNTAVRGGGAYSGTLTGCIVASNAASLSGGGFNGDGGQLLNCVLIGNSAESGGGTYFGFLRNCTLIGNSAALIGGGSLQASLQNSIIYYNSAPQGAQFVNGGAMVCCVQDVALPGGITRAFT